MRIATSASWRRSAARVVRVDVAGGDGRDAEGGGELVERGVAARVAALVGPLELDVERAGERAARAVRRRSGRRRRGPWRAQPERQTSPSACSATNAALVAGRQQVALAALEPRAGVRVGEDPAEVLVAAPRLAEERDVAVVLERDLGAGDRAHAEVLGGVGELERAVDAVVVGERERVVAELGGARGELLGQRRAVEERVGRVRVQLDSSLTEPSFRPAAVNQMPLSQSR